MVIRRFTEYENVIDLVWLRDRIMSDWADTQLKGWWDDFVFKAPPVFVMEDPFPHLKHDPAYRGFTIIDEASDWRDK